MVDAAELRAWLLHEIIEQGERARRDADAASRSFAWGSVDVAVRLGEHFGVLLSNEPDVAPHLPQY